MKTVKEIIDKICYDKRLSQNQLRMIYNQAHGKDVKQQTFNRTINADNMKFNQLVELLDAVGYELELKEKP